MGRIYWNPKSIILLFACFFLLIFPVGAKENLSPYFVKITDATKAVKEGKQDQARKLIDEIIKDFEKVENSDSEAGRQVQEKLVLYSIIFKKQPCPLSADSRL